MTTTRAVSYDIHYRQQGASDVAWSTPQNFKVGAEIVITGLTPGWTYDCEARARGPLGSISQWVTQPEIVVPSINARLSQGNLNMLRVGGIGSAWTGFSISYTATTTGATISCTAGTLQDGVNNPSYAASSIVVSGTAGTTVLYYLYYDDPAGTGGTLALGASATYSDLSANQGRIYVGAVSVTFPASGSGSGGGTPGGGCVEVDSLVLLADGTLRRAGEIVAGDILTLFDEVTLAPRSGVVSYSVPKLQPCVSIVTASGMRLRCSTTAPIPTRDGGLVLAPDVRGHAVAIRSDGARWDDVVSVCPIGNRWVQHITCENGCFWADGVGHHNMKPAS